VAKLRFLFFMGSYSLPSEELDVSLVRQDVWPTKANPCGTGFLPVYG